MILTLLILALATLVSEDLACIGAGLVVAEGRIGLAAASIACFVGIWLGDLLLFLGGRYIGRPAVRSAPLRWLISDDDLQRSARWFEKKGPAVIVLSRFLPGSRLPTYVAAGLLGADFWKFASYLALAGAVWTPLLVWFSMALGGTALHWLGLYQKYSLLAVVATGAVLWLLLKFVIPLFSFRGRRLLLSRWRRLTSWEFWPMWAFYPPVVVYVLWLAIKHRSLTLFTAANPAMFAGGFLGESKSEILWGLAASPEFVARHSVVANVGDVEEFMRHEGLTFPIVLKPDVGQRGLGVAVVHSRQDIEGYFSKPRGKTIVQEYIAGHEFGVFYYCHPGEAKGHIYSITEKRMVSVVGDGESTLEQQILKDDRAVCMARFFLKKHQRDLDRVPVAGETVQLSELGTHCRGALFLDGGRLKTPELEHAIHQISRRFRGFHIGRYDIRAPSVEDFQRGSNFKIVELNGVTSEATHIYQPGNSLLSAYVTLMKQWRICFEIAALNRAQGVAPVRPRQLLASLADYQPAHEAR